LSTADAKAWVFNGTQSVGRRLHHRHRRRIKLQVVFVDRGTASGYSAAWR
jgi:hypothetical protein